MQFLADAVDLSFSQDEIAKVVMNERTGTVVFGGDIRLAPCAIASGDLTITITTTNQVVQPNALATGRTALQQNTTVNAAEKGHQLTFVAGATTLASVVRALNALGVSPRDLICHRAGAAQRRVAASRLGDHLVVSPIDPVGGNPQAKPAQNLNADQKAALAKLHDVATQFEGVFLEMLMNSMQDTVPQQSLFGGTTRRNRPGRACSTTSARRRWPKTGRSAWHRSSRTNCAIKCSAMQAMRRTSTSIRGWNRERFMGRVCRGAAG